MKSLNDILPPEAAARVIAFRRALDRALPGAVEAVVLFGSRARGDARPDSDYDLAFLLRGALARRRDIKAKVADEAFEHVIEGFELTPVPLSADYLRRTDGLSHLTEDRARELIGPSRALPLSSDRDIRAGCSQDVERQFP